MQKLFRRTAAFLLALAGVAALTACSDKDDRTTLSKAESSSVTVYSDNSKTYRDITFSGDDIVTPSVIETKYDTEDVVVADYVVTNSYYPADPTGVEDSTDAIQFWLNAASHNGGGTVWMPEGVYRITSALTIPAFVTLRGDWQDPDKGTGYGTVISADVKATTADSGTGTIYIGGSAGVCGLTVYYPNQNMGSIKCYPFTFYIKGSGDGYMLQSIVNCTVINGYKGIGACVAEENAHEMLTVENFKGTFLACAAEAYNQADVGTWKNVSISADYWANASKKYKCDNPDSLKQYLAANTTGLILGDLEWTEFEGLTIKGCKTGINVVKGKRIEFAGSLDKVTITGCTDAIVIDTMDDRWGMVISRSTLEGSENALVNNSAGEVRATAVTFKGAVSGTVKRDKTSLTAVKLTTSKAVKKPEATLFVVEDIKKNDPVTDVAPAINAAIKEASEAGGGIVYVPAGLYRLSSAVTVPTGVELRGAGSVAQRDQNGSSGGTVFLVSYGTKGVTEVNQDSATALVTLAGESGMRNLRFVYLEGIKTVKSSEFAPCAYTVRGTGANVYAINVCISGTPNGIDFSACDNHFIKKYVSFCFRNAVRAGGKNGVIEGCLQNGTVLLRGDLSNYLGALDADSDSMDLIFNRLSRINTTYIILDKAEGECVYNTFCYGAATFLSSQGSTSVAVNIGADNLGSTTPMINLKGGSLTVVNMMRYNGHSFDNDGGKLKIYNRSTIAHKEESQSVSD